MKIDEYYVDVFLKMRTRRVLGKSLARFSDATELEGVASESLDVVILDRVLNRTYDYDATIVECKRILKAGGRVIATLLSVAPPLGSEENFWGFTDASARYMFGNHFRQEYVKVRSYGNVFSGRMLLLGVPAEELTKRELEFSDEYFPIIIGVEAIKE